MSYAQLKKQAHRLFESVPFITHIESSDDYAQALALMDELIEDYDYNKSLIDILSAAIERWEEQADEFHAFNLAIASIDSGVAVLKTLMSTHKLGVADFPEIGSKSLISKIINHERKLTRDHIQALCKRFQISPTLFFDSSWVR